MGASTPRPSRMRFQYVVEHAGEEQQHGVGDRARGTVVPAHPDVSDDRQSDQERRDLRNSQHQDDQCEPPCKRNVGDQQYHTDDDGLDDGHPEHTQCHRTNRRRGKPHELFAPHDADDAIEDGIGASGS